MIEWLLGFIGVIGLVACPMLFVAWCVLHTPKKERETRELFRGIMEGFIDEEETMEHEVDLHGMGDALLAEYRQCLREDLEGQIEALDREQKGKHPFDRKEERSMRNSVDYFISMMYDYNPRELTGLHDSRGNAVRIGDVVVGDRIDAPCLVSYYPEKGMWYASNGKGQCPLYELGLEGSFFEVVGNIETTDEFKGMEPCIMEEL